jgi:hypothetical protein
MRAIELTRMPAIFVDDDIDYVTYCHMLFDQHEVILSEDAPSENQFGGADVIKAPCPYAHEDALPVF